MTKLKKTILEEMSFQYAEFPEEISFSDVPQLLEQKGKVLSKANREIIEFLDTDHSADETAECENLFRRQRYELLAIKDVLDQSVVNAPNFSEERIERFYKVYSRLSQDVKSLENDLRDDRKDIEQKQKDKEFDMLKFYSFAIVIPSIAYAHLKLRFPENSNIPNIGFSAIFASGVFFHLRRNIKQAWKASIKDITPRDIKNSFVVYYVKQSSVDKAQKIKNDFGKAVNSITEKAKQSKPARMLTRRNERKGYKNDLR